MAGADLISASTFVRQNSVWTEVAPYMDPVIRAAKERPLGKAVPSMSDSKRNPLIAEAAYLVAGSDFTGRSYNRNMLGHKAKEFLPILPRNVATDAELSPDEWLEVGLLARITQKYTSTLPEAVFSPSIPGCGVVDAAIADVLAGSELVEIKTVTRPFRSYDLRQALTYTAMLYSSNYIIRHITLLNPRRARLVKMPVSRIAAGVRGGSAVELLQDLIQSMTDFQVSI